MEAQPVTPPSEKTPEHIEQEMLETRESLTSKVAELENHVLGTVKTAADTLTGTVDAVKSLVSNAPDAVGESVKKAAEVVSDSVKKTFDISGHVRAHPWAAVGVSALAGCLTGWLLSGGRRSLGYSDEVAPPPYTGAPTPTRTEEARGLVPEPPAAAGPSRPGVFDELFAMLGRKVREVAENVINTASSAVNDTVRDSVPRLVDAAAERLAPETVAGPGVPTPGGPRLGYRGDEYHS